MRSTKESVIPLEERRIVARLAVFAITAFFYRMKSPCDYTAIQSVDKPQVLFLRRLRRIYVFSLTRAAKKHLVSEKPLIQRFFKGTGVVLAGIECSPKISDFRANGIPVWERVDFFDTLKSARKGLIFYTHVYFISFMS